MEYNDDTWRSAQFYVVHGICVFAALIMPGLIQ